MYMPQKFQAVLLHNLWRLFRYNLCSYYKTYSKFQFTSSGKDTVISAKLALKLRPKKVILFPKMDRVKITHQPAQSNVYQNILWKKIKIYIKISAENLTGHDHMVCEFALRTFNLLDRVVNFSWLFIWIWCSLYATGEITVLVILRQHAVHTFKNKNKRKIIKIHFCLSFSLLYMFIRSCKFIIVETRIYDIAHDENAMSSLMIQSI